MSTPTYTSTFGWTKPNGWLKDMGTSLDSIDTTLTPHTATLGALGTVDIANTSITANSVILYTRTVADANAGHLSYVLDPGVKVTFNSSDALDRSVITYVIVKY